MAKATTFPTRPNGEQVRKVRDHLKMTQAEMGRLVHASARIVSEWERGTRNMRRDTWELLCIRTGLDKMPRFFEEDE